MKIKTGVSSALILLFMWIGCGSKEQKPSNEMKEVKIGFGHVGRLQTVFDDRPEKHLEAAHYIGIFPMETRKAAETSRHLESIETCELYYVQELTHSLPLLVPKAKVLVESIGKGFIDSLSARGAGSYRPIITSVLRVEDDLKRLRKGNYNASENSVHSYGTTVDIAYNRFSRTDSAFVVGELELKSLLSEVLRDLQKAGKCYVKYEIKQGCFHVTAR